MSVIEFNEGFQKFKQQQPEFQAGKFTAEKLAAWQEEFFQKTQVHIRREALEESERSNSKMRARLEFLRHNLTCNDMIRLCGQMGNSFEDAIDKAIARDQK